jgi:hypothetical protein
MVSTLVTGPLGEPAVIHDLSAFSFTTSKFYAVGIMAAIAIW